MRARIPVWFGTARPPFVPATLHWHVTESRATVNFVVDTGAFDIILSEDDAEDLGVDMGRLRPSKTPIGVIGGTVPSYDLHGVSAAFTCDKGRTHTFGLRCMRVMANKSGRRGGPGGEEACSLLGRRFLQDNDFSLHWEFGKEKAHLGAPDRHGQEIKGDFIPWETAHAATERVLKRTRVRNRRA